MGLRIPHIPDPFSTVPLLLKIIQTITLISLHSKDLQIRSSKRVMEYYHFFSITKVIHLSHISKFIFKKRATSFDAAPFHQIK